MFNNIFDIFKLLFNQLTFTILLVLVGSYYTYKSRFIQFRYFKTAWKIMFLSEESEHGLSSFHAAALSIGGRLGTGNIAGVALAIYIGGYGAIFWLWVAAFLGMAISFYETTLAQLYKKYDEDEHFVGGPMTYIARGLGSKYKFIAVLYGMLMIFTVSFAYIGIHTKTISATILAFTGVDHNLKLAVIISVIIAISSAYIIIGGTKKVASVSSYIVPVMLLAYIVLALTVVLFNLSFIPHFFLLVITNAFTPSAMITGGLFTVITTGFSLSTFSNEAGLGTSTLAAGLAEGRHPVEQALVNMVTIFIDSLIICTLTAFVIILAIEQQSIFIDVSNTSELAMQSFKLLYDGGDVLLMLFVSVFTFTTLIASVSYGITIIQQLFSNRSYKTIKRIEKLYLVAVLSLILVSPFIPLGGTVATFIVVRATIVTLSINVIAVALQRKTILKVLKSYDAGDREFHAKDLGIEDELTVWE